jgi:DNA polymerase III subunit epsilon
MYLFFDTETTGLPRRGLPPPQIVSLAWVLTDKTGRVLETEYHMIVPDGWTIPADATAIHGITTEDAVAHGKPILTILRRFLTAVERADALVAHNLEFDRMMVDATLLQHLGRPEGLVGFKKSMLCTMKLGKPVARVVGKHPGSYKYPKLSELYRSLFERDPNPASLHNALVDTLLLVECFWEMTKRLPGGLLQVHNAAAPSSVATMLRLSLGDTDA